MLLIYQIKVGICLIAFYLLWKLLLSHETFHRFNRVALLMVMVLALVLPWIRLTMNAPAPVAGQMVVLEELFITPNGSTTTPQAAQSWNMMNVATVTYLIGIAMVLLWLLHSQWNLHRILKKGRKEQLPGGITLHVVPGDISPFSYFKHIVINEEDYRDNSHEILVHEQAHINLRHSWDVLFTGLFAAFQWWNPAAWLLGRELRQVHEYEADEAVLNEGVDVKQYQLLLIKKSVGDQLFSMANNFNYQSLKKRIRMMTINKSSRWKRLRALAAVPVIALALLAFANPTIDAAMTTNEAVSVSPASVVQSPTPQTLPESVNDLAAPEAIEKTSDEQAPEAEVVPIEKTSDEQAPDDEKDQIYNTVDQMPQFPGGEAEMVKYLYQNIKYPENAIKNNVQGRVVVQFVIDKTGQVGDVKVVRSVDEEVDAEAVRVIKSMPKFEPGRQDGKEVAVWYTLPVSFFIRGDAKQPQQP